MTVASIAFVRVIDIPVRGPATLWDTSLTCELHGCTSHSPGRTVTRGRERYTRVRCKRTKSHHSHRSRLS